MQEKEVYKGKLLHLYKKKIKLPHGRLGNFEVIKHPGAALIVPFVSKTKVIILKQLRAVIGKYIYEFPAGTIDNNEKPLSCATREIIEETGFAANKFTKIGKIYPVPGYSTEIIHMYKAEGLIKKAHNFDEDEVIESEVMTKTQLIKLFKSGKIIDSKTICALAFLGWI